MCGATTAVPSTTSACLWCPRYCGRRSRSSSSCSARRSSSSASMPSSRIESRSGQRSSRNPPRVLSRARSGSSWQAARPVSDPMSTTSSKTACTGRRSSGRSLMPAFRRRNRSIPSSRSFMRTTGPVCAPPCWPCRKMRRSVATSSSVPCSVTARSDGSWIAGRFSTTDTARRETAAVSSARCSTSPSARTPKLIRACFSPSSTTG